MSKISKLLIGALVIFVLAPLVNLSAAQAQESSFLFRLYNPNTGDHFYTTNQSEKNSALSFGYRDEGILGTVAATDTATTTPLFRLYNPSTKDHFYTTSASERSTAINNGGYISEGTSGFVFTDEEADSTPIFRLFNSSTGDHFYTTDLVERLRATQDGYVFEGTVGFIKPRLHNLIRVNEPDPNDTITSPFTATGEARGNWYFEADFPISLFDEKGNLLTTGIGTAQGEWMTTNFVPFQSNAMTFTVPTSSDEGFMIFEKDNPSGLPQNNDQLIVPVRF